MAWLPVNTPQLARAAQSTALDENTANFTAIWAHRSLCLASEGISVVLYYFTATRGCVAWLPIWHWAPHVSLLLQ